MKRTYAVVTLILGAILGVCPAGASGIVPEKSTLIFVGKQMGAPVEGSFRRFDAEVTFKPADLAHSHAKIEIDLTSIDLASDESETEIKRKSWFNVAAFPKAVFESTSFKAVGGNRFEVIGHLSIKGVTRDMTVPLQFRTVAGAQVAEGSVVIRRSDFKVGEGVWADPDSVAEEVQIRYKMTLKP